MTKRIIVWYFGFLLSISLMALGQQTSVTGTITTAWASGSYSISFVGQQGVHYTLNGNNFTQIFSGTLDGTGSLSASLADNNAISPAGSQWKFSFCASVGVPCFSVQATIAGTSQSISSQLQAAAPPINGSIVPNPIPGTSLFSPLFGPSSAAEIAIGNVGQISPLGLFLNSNGGLGVAISAKGIIFPDGSLQTSAASGSVLPAISGATTNLALTNNGSTANWGVLSVSGGGTGAGTFTANGLIFGNGTSALGVTSAPTVAGTILYFNGTNWVLLNGNTGSTQCLTESSAGVPSWGTCGSGGGLPSSWTVGTNNFVTAAPTASTDTSTLSIVPALATGGTMNIFQVGNTSLTSSQAGCTANVYFAITYNGNMCFAASNLQLSTTSAPPYLYLNGMGGGPGQPSLREATAALNTPTGAASNATTGGTITAGTYYFKITWVNAGGETPGSTEFSTTTTTATSTITLTAPGAQYSAFGYQIYEATTSGSEKIIVPTSGICTLASQTFGGNAVCAPMANATFTAPFTQGSLTPPTMNTSGGAYIASLAPYAEGVGEFLASGAPGADAPVGAGLLLPGGTGVNFTSGATTTAQTLACFSGSETVSQCAANAANVMGVFEASGQNAAVQINGVVTINLAASATTTYGHFACSNATAGTIIDSASACAAGQQVGFIAQSNGTAVTSVPVFLQPASGGGSANAIVNNPTATQTITPGNTTTEGLVIASNGGTSTDAFDVNQNGWNSIRVNGYGQIFLTHAPSVDNLNIDFNNTGGAINFDSNKDHITEQSGGNNDISGFITITSATFGTYSFTKAYTSAPSCTASPVEATAGTIPATGAWAVFTSTAEVRVDVTTSGSYTFSYHCFGAPD